MDIKDFLVVGAGPAGLAFASSINTSNVLVVDLGKPVSERCRHSPEECVQGAGGAGLFSDGKFSFYPAGTELWKGDVTILKEAYNLLEKDFSPYGIIPPFPEITPGNHCLQDNSGWCFKPYPSLYLSLEARYSLIDALANRCSKILYETECINYRPINEGYLVMLKSRSCDEPFFVKTKELVLAGGRFMPLFLQAKKRFRRYEFGFRITGPADCFQKDGAYIDPKYILHQPGVEWRTFCWCERGEVVLTRFKEIQSYSGRADCAPTDSSNFGFNIRVKDEQLLSKADFQKLLKLAPFQTSLSHFCNNMTDYYPPSCARLIEYGLSRLLERFPSLNDTNISVVGPTIEGVGHYPDVDKISIIGDCGGSYRGIIPSMLSGYSLAFIHNQNEVFYDCIKSN